MHGVRDALRRQGQPRSATGSPEGTLLQPQAERQPLTIARFAHRLLTVCSLGSSWRLPLLLKRLKGAKSKATMFQKGRSQQSADRHPSAGTAVALPPRSGVCSSSGDAGQALLEVFALGHCGSPPTGGENHPVSQAHRGPRPQAVQGCPGKRGLTASFTPQGELHSEGEVTAPLRSDGRERAQAKQSLLCAAVRGNSL